MTQLTTFLVTAVILAATFASPAQARWRLLDRSPWRFSKPKTREIQEIPAPPARPADRYSRDPSWFHPELYPQWYGGFHGRHLQNYGYPPGDIGIRGSAW